MTAARDRIVKRDLYARAGIRHHWLLDVDARTLEAFELVATRWTLLGTYGEPGAAPRQLLHGMPARGRHFGN